MARAELIAGLAVSSDAHVEHSNGTLVVTVDHHIMAELVSAN
jgi:hypothetical protein